jgi:hypothetical protein
MIGLSAGVSRAEPPLAGRRAAADAPSGVSADARVDAEVEARTELVRVGDSLIDAPRITPRPSLSARVKGNLTLMTGQLGLHVSNLTADLVRFNFDFARKFGQFKVGGGASDSFLFRIDGDVEVHGSVARITSRLDLGIGGERLTIDLPDMDLATQTVAGERAVELRLPVFEGRF